MRVTIQTVYTDTEEVLFFNKNKKPTLEIVLNSIGGCVFVLWAIFVWLFSAVIKDYGVL